MQTIVTRRSFARQMAQLLAFGGLAHFSLDNVAWAAASKGRVHEDCPGGLPTADVCSPPDDEDYCPGEMSPADECPSDGNRNEDVCNSGLPSADICTTQKVLSDQCQSANIPDDECSGENTPIDDFCPSGRTESDFCPQGGSIAQGDMCPGGSDDLDDCKGGGAADQCDDGTFGPEDDCQEGWDDDCASYTSLLDDDSCPNERNVPYSLVENGWEDLCFGNFIASDDCTTGTSDDDLCNSGLNSNGGFDVCPGGLVNVDACGIVYADENGYTESSDDYCVAGTGSDECHDGMPPEDECAGGVPDEDLCYVHKAGSDECDSFITGSDQGGCKSDTDECKVFGLLDSCTYNQNKDIAE